MEDKSFRMKPWKIDEDMCGCCLDMDGTFAGCGRRYGRSFPSAKHELTYVDDWLRRIHLCGVCLV